MRVLNRVGGRPRFPRRAPTLATAAHVFRPPRRDGAVAPAVAAALALLLALGLLIRGVVRGVSFASFTGDVVALLLLCLAGLFASWAYAIYNLRYLVDDEALVIVWGASRQVIPAARIERVVLGRKLGQPRVDGMVWPGCCVGRGRVERLGQVFFYAAHRSPSDLVYVSTTDATFGISLGDARGLARSLQAAQERSQTGDVAVAATHRVVPARTLLADRRALLLASTALLAFLVAAGYTASRYSALPLHLALPYPPVDGPMRVGSRAELLRLPATACIWLLLGLTLAAWSHAKIRAVSYALLAGTVFAECLYVVAAIAAAH